MALAPPPPPPPLATQFPLWGTGDKRYTWKWPGQLCSLGPAFISKKAFGKKKGHSCWEERRGIWSTAPKGQKSLSPWCWQLQTCNNRCGEISLPTPDRRAACSGEQRTEEAFLSLPLPPILSLLGLVGGQDSIIPWPPIGSRINGVNLGRLLSNLCASLTSKLGVKTVPGSQPWGTVGKIKCANM